MLTALRQQPLALAAVFVVRHLVPLEALAEAGELGIDAVDSLGGSERWAVRLLREGGAHPWRFAATQELDEIWGPDEQAILAQGDAALGVTAGRAAQATVVGLAPRPAAVVLPQPLGVKVSATAVATEQPLEGVTALDAIGLVCAATLCRCIRSCSPAAPVNTGKVEPRSRARNPGRIADNAGSSVASTTTLGAHKIAAD